MAPPAPAVAVGAKRRWWHLTEKGRALWVLALLSPVIAEMFSGSSPPREFFFPWSFALLLGLYGAGVLIVRELSVIWDKGWASIILLGAAYGILEEGVAVKSFFDPEWMDLGGLGVYGRVLGTNWVWAFWLTIYHSAVSICLPILIVSMLYPHIRRERFLPGRKLTIVFLILFLDALVCASFLNPYGPDLFMYLLSICAVFAFVGAAALLPKNTLRITKVNPVLRPRSFFLLGFVFLLMSFLISGAFVDTGAPFIVPILLLLAMSAVVLMVLDSSMSFMNSKVEKAYFASGMMGFMFILGLVLVLGGWIDMVICVALTLMFMIDFTRWSKGQNTLIAHRLVEHIYGEK